MRLFPFFLLFCPQLSLQLAQSQTHPEFPTLKTKIVPGIYSEELPPPNLLYSKVVPIVFEFRLKSEVWSSPLPLGLKPFKLLPRLNCRNDGRASTVSTNDWAFACPVFYHLNEYVKQVKANYSDIFYKPSSKSSDYQKFSHDASLPFDDCAQLLSRGWKGIYANFGLAEYKLLLESCSSLPPHFEESITDYSYDVSPQFDAMRDNFMSTFFLNVSNPDPGEMINALMTLQTLLLTNVQAELGRLREATTSCASGRIPYSLIKGPRLEKALGEVKSKIAPHKYSLHKDLSVSKLLKLPLADCIASGGSLFVQILLPVLKIEQVSSLSLIRFSYPQFLYGDSNICSLQTLDGKQPQPTNFLFDKASKSLTPSNCRPNELCLIPDRSGFGANNHCISELINSSLQTINVRERCDLTCDKGVSNISQIFPIIRRVSGSRFIVTGNRISTLLIKCEGESDRLIPPQSYGAVEVTLACKCYLSYPEERYGARSPCGSATTLLHVLPEHMVDAIEGQGVNVSLFGEKKEKVRLVEVEKVTKLEEDNGTLWLWIFVGLQSLVLSGIVGAIFCKLGSMERRLDYAGGRTAVCFSVSQMTNLDEHVK